MTNRKTRSAACKLGAADYIRKPLQRDALRAGIKTHTDLLQIQQALEQKTATQGQTYELIFERRRSVIAIRLGSDPSDEEI